MSSLKPIAMLMLVFVSVSIAQAHAATFQNYELSIFGSIWQAIVNFFGSLLGSSNTATVSTTISTTIGTTQTTTVNLTSTTYNSTSTSTLPTSTSSQTTTIYTNSYLSHPICSPTNNTTYSYPDNVTCPSSCPYASTMYYEGVYSPNGAPIIQTVPIGQHVCLYSPVTTTTTSTITTSSTTTIPQPIYYSFKIIQNPNLAINASFGLTYVCDSFLNRGYYSSPSWWVTPSYTNNQAAVGDVVNISAVPSCIYDGVSYNFNGWDGTGIGSITSNAFNITVVIKGNITEEANYIPPTTTIPQSTTTIPRITNYSLTMESNPVNLGQAVIRYGMADRSIYSMNTKGMLSWPQLPNSTRYPNGANLNISVVNVPQGWIFTGWSCSGNGCYSGNLSPVNITLNNNITETENFVPIYYSLSLKKFTGGSCSGNVSQSGNGTYKAGSVVTLYATPAQVYPAYGCDFEEWYGNGYSGTSPIVNITMNSDMTETAYWRYNTVHPPNAACSNNTALYVYSTSSNVYCPSSCSFLITTTQFSVSPYSGTFCLGDNVSTQWADYTGVLGTMDCAIVEHYGQAPAGIYTGIEHWIYYYGTWWDCW